MPHMYSQLLNSQLENSSGNPASGGTPMGRIYIDTTNSAHGLAKYYDGTAYVPFGAVRTTLNTTATVTYNSEGNNETVYNTSASTISSLALTLPSTTISGQVVRYVTKGVCSAVVVSGTVSVGAALTSLAANGSVAYQAVDAAGTFIRLM